MKLISAEPIGVMPVYDLAVDHDDHSFLHDSGAILHNCAFAISDEPISNFIPLMTIGDTRVTQYTAKSVEAAGILKMDFLTVNSLNDIERAIRLIQDRHAPEIDWSKARRFIPDEEEVPYLTINKKNVPYVQVVPFNGSYFDVWDLPADQNVFNEICSGNTETVFQFNTPSARQWLREFVADDGTHAIRSLEGLAVFTALDRPGPLDYVVEGRNMLQEYAARAKGEDPVQPNEALLKLLPETHGIIVFQEQLQRVFQEIGKTTGIEANNFRDDIGKKRMAKVMKWKDVFMKGAVETLGEEDANKLWAGMETFGQYGFNKSHAVCYSDIGYACAWLKHHYPLEWWTAVLSNAERKEVETKFWPHCGHLIETPSLKDSGHDFEIHGERIKAPLWLLNGIGPNAHEELCEGMPYVDIQDFCNKIEARKIRNGKLNEETGKLKKGRSTLNRTIIAKLIISGAADSLFPADADIYTKFNLYQEAEKRATGAKKAKTLDAKFTQLGVLERFQLRKSILPSYGMNLTKLFLENESLRPKFLTVNPKRNGDLGLYAQTTKGFGPNDDRSFRCLPGEELDWILKDMRSVDVPAKIAAVGYIHDIRPFVYQVNKSACELAIEVDGYRFSMVKWGGKEGLVLPDNLPGSIVAMSFVKFKEGGRWNLDDMEVLQSPLNLKAEESSS